MVFKAVIAVFAIVIVAFLGVAMFGEVLEDAGERESVVNETFDPLNDTFVTLAQSNKGDVLYGDHPSVYNNSSVRMNQGPGDDFVWNETDGTIRAVKNGSLDQSNNSTISYSWARLTEEQKQLNSLLSIIPNNIGLIIVVLMVILLLIFLT